MKKFKVGDKVRINTGGDYFTTKIDGKVGKIVNIESDVCAVSVPNVSGIWLVYTKDLIPYVKNESVIELTIKDLEKHYGCKVKIVGDDR